jgi:hypothetical protein
LAAHLGRAVLDCAVVRAVALAVTFIRLRHEPALRVVAEQT